VRIKTKGKIGFVLAMVLFCAPLMAAKPSQPVALEFVKEEHILVEWKGQWWNAKILKKKNNLYYVHYLGWSNKWNEWVKISRMAKVCK
jgi:ABC-type antimicrobial peptide transport system ATPase subunit